MHLERLELADFRSYTAAHMDLGPGVRVLVGGNAQGKTNVLEAVQLLATGGSHRVTTSGPLIRAGATSAVVRVIARVAGRGLRVELELRAGGRDRSRVNGQPQSRVGDAVGLVRAVLFAPEDLALVRGEPTERRRFLDELLGQRRPAYRAARQEYERVLRQRTALLRGLRGGKRPSGEDGARANLVVWTDAVIATGATLIAARVAAVHALAGPTGQAYRDLVSTSPARPAEAAVVLDYALSTGRIIRGRSGQGVPDPADLAEELREGLAEVADAERERGQTLVGPHRDDLVLGLGNLPAKGYASHGETWSLALALRLASREVLVEVGEEPVVLLDDVFAELDEHRRGRLAQYCGRFEQVLVTAAVDDDVPLDGPRYTVSGGQIRAASTRMDGQGIAAQQPHRATDEPQSGA